MNLQLIDPFQKPVPDRIECTLSYFGNEDNEDSDDDDRDDEIATCCAFNRHGNYLLVGYATGDIIIWDFYTRGIAREIHSHTHAVTAVGWSRDGRHVFSAAMDGCIHAWSLERIPPTQRWSMSLGEIGAKSSSQGDAGEEEEDDGGCAIISAQCHPTQLGCVVCCTDDGKAYKVDLVEGKKQQFLLHHQIESHFKSSNIRGGRNKVEHLIKSVSIDKEGTFIFAGNGKGRIFVLDMQMLEIVYSIVIRGCSSAIELIEFSKDGNWFLVNSNDRMIRMYEKHNTDGVSAQDFQDVVNRVRWRKCCFSADNEHVVAATKDDYQYLLYVWSTSGQLVQTLVGPKEGMLALGWHPWRTFLAVCLLDGNVNIWSNDAVTNWSAFAPDFKELQENIEYVEKEDEFDIAADDPCIAWQKSKNEEEQDVDIETLEKIQVFESDSEDNIFYLYTKPVHQVVEKAPDEHHQVSNTSATIDTSILPDGSTSKEKNTSSGDRSRTKKERVSTSSSSENSTPSRLKKAKTNKNEGDG